MEIGASRTKEKESDFQAMLRQCEDQLERLQQHVEMLDDQLSMILEPPKPQKETEAISTVSPVSTLMGEYVARQIAKMDQMETWLVNIQDRIRL